MNSHPQQHIASPVLHHVNLKTIRPDEMIDWYGQVVGKRVLHRFPAGALMSNDAANHRLALPTSQHLSDDAGRATHCGIHHLAFEFPTIEDVLGTYERIKRDHNHRPHMAIDHGITLSL
jgi:catechol 2,3-dioxygenase